MVKCIIILLSTSSVKWPWWRWKKPFGYFMTATSLLALSLPECTSNSFITVFSCCFEIWFFLITGNKLEAEQWNSFLIIANFTTEEFIFWLGRSRNISKLTIKMTFMLIIINPPLRISLIITGFYSLFSCFLDCFLVTMRTNKLTSSLSSRDIFVWMCVYLCFYKGTQTLGGLWLNWKQIL